MSKPKCSVTGCDKPARRREWCAMHHTRWLRHGDVNFTQRQLAVGPPIERFMAKVALGTEPPSAPGPCWLWTGSQNHHGYGMFGRGGRGKGMAKAHRWSYEHFHRTYP